MKKTDTELTELTGYNFTDGSPRGQNARGSRLRLVNGSLFQDKGNNDWNVVAEVIWTDDYIFALDTKTLKKGDRVISYEKRYEKTHSGTVTGCGEKTFVIKLDQKELGEKIHYHRNTCQDDYYLTFEREGK